MPNPISGDRGKKILPMVKYFKIFLFAAMPSIIMSVMMLLLYPLFLYPEFTGEIVLEARKNSRRIATHFINEYYPNITSFTNRITDDLDASIQRDIENFNLWKVRFFNPDGEILYSSENSEIGQVNQKPYFVESVAEGQVIANMIRKNDRTEDGTPAPYDVVETYIPVMLKENFKGAFEVYVNVTQQMQRLRSLFWRSYLIFSLVVCILLSLIVIFSLRMDKAAKERENMITELQDALAEVRKLRGIIPICAACKKVRDDKGYWSQIESYIREHSEADFSHGICPDCAKTLYPDLEIDKREC